MSTNNIIIPTRPERRLSGYDDHQHVYLCEHGLIHLVWNTNDLVYCPGDFLGLPYLLTGLLSSCDLECTRGEDCPQAQADGFVYLRYASVQIPLELEECRRINMLVRKAVNQLYALRRDGYFSQQAWLPQVGVTL